MSDTKTNAAFEVLEYLLMEGYINKGGTDVSKD